MLDSLSPQERRAVTFYDEVIRAGNIVSNDLWADGFTYKVFRQHPDGPIVDIGCGTGRAIAALEGYEARDYIGIDPSEESIAYCQATFPDMKFMVSEVRLLGEQFPERSADFFS